MSEPHVRPRALTPHPPPKRCPWCDDHEVAVSWDRSALTRGVTYHVRCYICNARGPSNYNVDFAVARWNGMYGQRMDMLSGILQAESVLRETKFKLRFTDEDDDAF